MRRPDRSRAGIALLLLTWAVILLTMLLGPALDEALQQRRIVAARHQRLRAAMAARAGVERVIAELAADDPASDGPGDGWADNDAAFHDVPVSGRQGSAARYTVAGATAPGGRQCRFGAIDEDRKLPVRMDASGALERCPGMTADVLRQLLSLLRTSDDMLLPTHRSMLALPALKPGLFFGEDFNEDGLLQQNENDGNRSPPADDGNGQLRRGLSDYLAVYTDGRINANTAPAEVLAALPGMKLQSARALVQARERAGGAFRSEEELAGLAAVKGVAAASLLKVNSSVFRAGSRGRVDGTNVAVRVEAVLRRENGKIDVLFYRED